MKLLVFTPVSHVSAIARMANWVNQKLWLAGHSVTTVSTELTRPDLDSAFFLGQAPRHWTDTDEVQALLHNSDGVVYHVGDNHLFHAGALEWLPRRRGLVCLHDFYLGNLFQGWAVGHPDAAARAVESWCPKDVADGFFDHPTAQSLIEATHQAAPMTEWLAHQASSVIAHSAWGLGRVRSVCPGPVLEVPLAYDFDEHPNAAPKTLTSGFQLLTVGQINNNKRVDAVIEALGRLPKINATCSYTLAGAIEPDVQERLLSLASRWNVSLNILGAVTAEALQSALANADVVMCLRNPPLEAASASAIEAMLFGRAVVVENHGFYAELPDGCVVKVDPANEVESLVHQLERLYHQEAWRQALAENGQIWARQTFTAKAYASALAQAIPASEHTRLICQTMGQFVHQLDRWGQHPELITADPLIKPLDIFNI